MGGGLFLKIGIIGGDRREEILSEILAERGYEIKVLSDIVFNDKKIEFHKDYRNVIADSELVYAPLPGVDEIGYLKKSFVSEGLKLDREFFSQLGKETLFLIGSLNDSIKKEVLNEKIRYIETARLPELAILNAIPTAEGAIKIAIERTPFTLFGSKLLITGLGKVGLTLAWRLKALGSDLFAATRDREAIARGRDLGLNMVSYNDLEGLLPKIDIIFNTVPVRIIKERHLRLMKEESLIIDLASSPGGLDYTLADSLDIDAIPALGLPGRTAPKTAAEILAEMVENIIDDYFRDG